MLEIGAPTESAPPAAGPPIPVVAPRRGRGPGRSLFLPARLCLLLALTFSAGCDRREADVRARSLPNVVKDTLVFSRVDSAGIPVIETHSPTLQHPWTVSELPALRLGEVAGRPDYEFDRVVGALRLADGGLVVANSGSGELRWYSADGTYLRSLGGPGSGPGEYRSMQHIFWLPGDSIGVADSYQARISTYSPEGDFVRSTSFPELRGHATVTRFRDGSYLAVSNSMILGATGPTRTERLPLDVIRHGGSAGRVDPVATFDGFEAVVGWNGRFHGDGSRVIARFGRPFGRSTLVAGNADGWVVVETGRPEVQFRDSAGGVRLVARWTFDPRAVTRSALVAERDLWVDSGPDRRNMEEAWEELPDPPTAMPVFATLHPLVQRSLHLDREGNVWAKEYSPAGEVDENRYFVIRSDGVWLGHVNLPGGTEILSIGTDHVVLLSRDDLGVESVSVHGLEGPRARTSSAAELHWLAGCWEARSGDLLIEELWLEPLAGTLLGLSRTTRHESLVGYEFMRIYSRGDTLVFAAQPSGRPPTEFLADAGRAGEVVFENLAHDFPQRVRYRAVGSDSLLARIEGLRAGELQAIDFPYARTACPA